MQYLQVLLVEDDPSAALGVEMLLEDMGMKLAAVKDNGGDAINYIYAEQPDLIILDIELQGELTGLDVAREIKHLSIPTIFTTSHNDKKSFEAAKLTDSLGYLVKPFDRLSLQSILEQTVRSVFPEGGLLDEPPEGYQDVRVLPGTILVKHVNVFYPIRFNEVLFIQGEGNYCSMHTESKKFMLKLSLRKLAEWMPVIDFVPIHRSYIVRLDKIESIDVGNGRLAIGKEVLPLARGFKNALLERFNILR